MEYIAGQGNRVWPHSSSGMSSLAAGRRGQDLTSFTVPLGLRTPAPAFESILASHRGVGTAKDVWVLRQLLDAGSNGFWLATEDLCVLLYVSQACETIWGIPRHQFYTQFFRWLQTLHPEDCDRVMQEIDEVKTGAVVEKTIAYRILRPDQTVRWVNHRFFLIHAPEEGCNRIGGIVEDITEQKQAEFALAEQLQLTALRADVDAALASGVNLELMLASCVQSCVLYLQAPLVQLWAYQTEQKALTLGCCVGESCPTPVIQTPEISLGQGLLGKIAEQQKPWSFLRDGPLPDLPSEGFSIAGIQDMAAYPLFQDNQLLGVLAIWTAQPLNTNTLASLQLISRQLAQGIQRKQVELKLREREQQLDALINNLPHCAWLKDPDGQYILVNQALAKACGLDSPQQVIGKTDDDLWPPAVADLYRKGDAMVIKTQYSQKFEEVLTEQHQWFETSKTPILDSAGNLIGTTGIAINITERKRVEQEMRSLQERLQTLLNTSPAVIFSRTPTAEFRTTFIGDNAETVLGYPPAELQRDPDLWLRRIHPDDRPRALDYLPLLSQQADYCQTYRFLPAQGDTYCWLQECLTILKDDQDNPLELVGYLVDITAQKQAEESIRRQSLLMDQVTGSVVVIDLDYRVRLWSKGSVELFGYLPEEIIGQSIEILHPMGDWPSVLGAIETLQTQGQFTSEFPMRRKSGALFYGLLNLGLETNANGEVLGVMGHCVDVTDRYLAETKLRQQALLLDQLNGSIVCANPQGTITHWSKGAEDLIGFTAAEAIGQSISILHPPEDMAYVQEQIIRPVLVQGYNRAEAKICRKSGEPFDGLISLALERNAAGEVLGMVGYCVDISDRKQTEAALRQSNEQLSVANTQLERATRLKDEFLANMSHELRTPLNAILGLSEGLLDEVYGELNPKQKKYLGSIERSGQHLLELINDILDLAKIESGKFALDWQTISVLNLCQTSLSVVKPLAAAKDIQLELALDAPWTRIQVDERRMRQVLINLLSNAVKFTPVGGRISLEIVEITPWIQFKVTDTGIGIAPAHLDQLFQAFVQIDSTLSRQYTGTGLGLALVKRIVEFHGGQVSVDSQEGVGSCFTVALPVSPTAPSPEASGALSAVPPPSYLSPPEHCEPEATKADVSVVEGARPEGREQGSIEPRAATILLAEDHATNIETFSSYLLQRGYRLLYAHNGIEAIQVAQDHQPDLILMDIQMPQMDGLEAIRHLRMITTLQQTPIIAVTALAMTGDRDQCFAAGATDYLTKPIRLRELYERIQKLLANRD
jgi:PAS domain S-box-containing protein